MKSRTRSKALRESDVAVGACKPGYADGKQVAIFNVEGTLYATQAECTHAGGPLCEGELVGDEVICPWHGSQFNVRTGAVLGGPATEPLTIYPVEVKDGVVVVKYQ